MESIRVGCCTKVPSRGTLPRMNIPGRARELGNSSPGSAAGRQGSGTGTGTENISWSGLGRIRARLPVSVDEDSV